MAYSLAALKTEINSDPAALGYAGKSLQEIADILNSVYNVAHKINKGEVPSGDVVKQFVAAELGGLSTGQLNLLFLLLCRDTIDISDTKVQDILKGIFTSANFPLTRAALIAFAQRQATRAEYAFQEPNLFITWQMIAEALNS